MKNKEMLDWSFWLMMHAAVVFVFKIATIVFFVVRYILLWVCHASYSGCGVLQCYLDVNARVLSECRSEQSHKSSTVAMFYLNAAVSSPTS